jgi:hypothetical protein
LESTPYDGVPDQVVGFVFDGSVCAGRVLWVWTRRATDAVSILTADFASVVPVLATDSVETDEVVVDVDRAFSVVEGMSVKIELTFAATGSVAPFPGIPNGSITSGPPVEGR